MIHFRRLDPAPPIFGLGLTHAGQGMIIFVPRGSANDPTRSPAYYDQTFDFLLECGLPISRVTLLPAVPRNPAQRDHDRRPAPGPDALYLRGPGPRPPRQASGACRDAKEHAAAGARAHNEVKPVTILKPCECWGFEAPGRPTAASCPAAERVIGGIPAPTPEGRHGQASVLRSPSPVRRLQSGLDTWTRLRRAHLSPKQHGQPKAVVSPTGLAHWGPPSWWRPAPQRNAEAS